MKLPIITTLSISLFLVGCTNGQTNSETMGSFEYTYKNAHPKAQALMKDEFYWSPIEETAPFGSDDGWDAAYGFRGWRLLNKTTSPVTYLKELIIGWGYPFFDYHEMDTTKIKEYLNQEKELSEADIQQQIKTLNEIDKNSGDTPQLKLDENQLRELIISSSKGMGGIYLLGQDNAIIGIGFAQFVLEGRVDSDIKGLAIIAIKRQLLPLFINRYDSNYRDIRKQQLVKMLEVINKTTS